MNPTEQLAKYLPFTLCGYTFAKVLGSGGFSTVFQVIHNSSGQYFAAKACPIPTRDTKNRNVALSEMHFLRTLYHPNIIKIYDIIEGLDHIFMILEYLSFGSSKKLVTHNQGMRYTLLLSAMKQVLTAVSFCHAQNIAHRDIKPDNILFDPSGRCVLSDFGLSCTISHDELSKDFSGSLPFKAPEVLKRMHHDPFKADMWSIGVTFYYWATGKMPWSSQCDIRGRIMNCVYTVPKNVPPAVASIIQQTMVLDPLKRSTSNELLQLPIFKNMKHEKFGELSVKVPLAVRTKVKDVLFQQPRRKIARKSLSVGSFLMYLGKSCDSNEANQQNDVNNIKEENNGLNVSTLPPLKANKIGSPLTMNVSNDSPVVLPQNNETEDSDDYDDGPIIKIY